jgi:3',5'-cyclic AMP phosphodiesterase CpdA
MKRFIHISDTHIGPTKDFALYDQKPAEFARRLVKAIIDLPFPIDFVLHTGDVVADPDDRSYALVAEIFSKLSVPIYYVTGNHDDPSSLAALPSGPLERFESAAPAFAYQVDFGEYELLVLDGKGPAEIDPQGRLSEEQFETLRKQLAEASKPVVISIHFPARAQDCLWLNSDMLLQDGDRFHRIVSGHADKVVGVFSGHVHRSLQLVEDGVLYVSAGSAFCGFRSWPNDERHVPLAESGFFSLVTVGGSRVTVKQYQSQSV